MKKFFQFIFVLAILFTGISNTALAEGASVTLKLRSGETIIFAGTVPLQPTENIELNGHTLNANSVLAVLNDADVLSPDFSISDLQYYDSFGSFYIKCINSSAGSDCDNWQYVVDDSYPDISVDQKILSGGETVQLYFGPQYKITLDKNTMTTADILIVTAEKYDYENNAWVIRSGAITGLTQTNPDDPFSPIEISTISLNDSGHAVFSGISEGFYNIGIKEDFYFPTEPLTVTAAPVAPDTSSPSSSGSSGGGNRSHNKSKEAVLDSETKEEFDLEKAFEFLVTQQKENGSFGEDLYTDWIAVALAGGNYQENTIKLIRHLGESKMASPTLTDYERHAMALMALGLNPYNTNGENYIEKIVASFDGKQFGNPSEDNDDIFALIVLQNAGFIKDENIIKNTITNIISAQKENGSWSESIDMTGAGIEALASFSEEENVKSSLTKAKEFLKEKQKDDGGWENASSTAWAMEGILALSEKPEDWEKDDNTPLNYLAELQDIDGGIKEENLQNKIWQTAYVLSALSGKNWNQIMQKFNKPKESEGQSLENSARIVLGNSKEKKVEQKIVKKSLQKLENLESQNTATVINAINDLPTQNTEERQPVKKNWFRNLLEKILSIF